MQVRKPTHVVTIGVWDTARGKVEYVQCWVKAGPFDDGEVLIGAMGLHLRTICDAVEVVEARQTSERPPTPSWLQLSLLE